jgi:glutamine cyclotransferase
LPQIVEPVKYTYNVKAVYPHDTNSYTQGLQFIDGQLWEGTGEWGTSVLQKVDLQSGKAEVLARLPKSEFGEGITVLGDKVYQLTWTNNTAHVYDLTGKEIKTFRYPGEGWGLTTDGEKLYMSDGSERIYKINPETFKREGTIAVTLRGEPVEFLNELEWIDGKIWANVYTSDFVVIIDPKSGVVEGVIDFRGLISQIEVKDDTDVFNGIAYDAATKRIFVTGKLWNKLFEVELVKR